MLKKDLDAIKEALSNNGPDYIRESYAKDPIFLNLLAMLEFILNDIRFNQCGTNYKLNHAILWVTSLGSLSIKIINSNSPLDLYYIVTSNLIIIIKYENIYDNIERIYEILKQIYEKGLNQ